MYFLHGISATLGAPCGIIIADFKPLKPAYKGSNTLMEFARMDPVA
jgi:hypothetical protein